MTQTELARRLGLAPSTVTKWISGAHSPSGPDVLAIAKELDVEPSPLLVAAGWIPPGYTIGEQILPERVARLMRLLPPDWEQWSDAEVRRLAAVIDLVFPTRQVVDTAAAG